MLKKTISGIMLTILLMGTSYTLLNLKPAAGWSNGGYSSDPNNPNYGTHDWIAQHALDWLPNKEKEYIVSNLAIYLYGTELPDNAGAPDGIGDTVLHHIYYWSNESIQDDASAVRAQTEYDNALNYMISGNATRSAKTLGIMSHYIVDVGVFGHVMGSGTDWGSEVHHSDYETYVNERTNSYDDEFNTYLAFDGSLDAISAYDAACSLAFDTTFDLDGDLTCVWMDENYNWGNPTFKDRCGESLNLAVNLLADALHTFYEEAFRVSGKVTESDGATPIVGARVEALQEGDLVLGSATTDAEGAYSLALPAGLYKVSVSANHHLTVVKPIVNATEGAATVNFNLTRGEMVVFDDFKGTSLNTSKWDGTLGGWGGFSNATSEPTQFSYVGLSNVGGGAAITSKVTAALDSTIIFEGRVSAYCEGHWYPGVYNDKQPRGLRVGTDPNNAIEFISYARDTVEARTVASGVATVSQYLLPLGKWVADWNLTYRIEVDSTSARFYVNDFLIATHTTNIPTGPLNIYMGTGAGATNVPVSADYLYMAAIPPWKDWNHYHNYTEIVNTLRFLNTTYPSIVDVFSIGKSWLNQDIYCIRLTNESNTHPKPKLFFVGYHHAREPISAELPLYFAVEAATNFGTNETITHMLNYSEIYIVPMLNVDAFDTFKQNEWQRKNVHPYDEDNDTLLDEDPPDDEDADGYIENLFYWDGYTYYFIRWEGIDDDSDGSYNEDWVGGVDLNRNYGYQWNATCDSGSPYPWAEDYRGPAPFSEPETQTIRDLALTHNFKYAVSFHSGAEVILYPWGYTDTPTPHNSLFREVAGNLSNLIGAPYGQSGGSLYTSSGLWDDWMYGNRSTFALTCEIYTNSSAWQYEPGPDPNTWWEKGVFQFFNPDPAQIETVIQRWLPVFTYTTNRAITEAYDTATNNVTPLKTIVGQGYSMHINVTVANQGEFTETFNVKVYANTTVISQTEVTLTSGNSTTITFTWNTTGFAKGNYTISAYAWPVPSEIDTADNTFTDGIIKVVIPGNINGDGIVDIFDAVLLAGAAGSTPGTLLWNPNADLNGDEIIDIFDAVILAGHAGEHDP